MANENKLVPKNPNEVVVPIGNAKLVTTIEEVDKALEIAGRIFREQNEEKNMDNTELTQNIVVDTMADVQPVEAETSESVDSEELTTLTDMELAELPPSKFGRDAYGRALNRNGTPRKSRNDKGVKRGAYGPRSGEEKAIVDSE